VSEAGAYSIVLTGGIASGKSAVASRFSALNVPVIDADRLAHELVEPGRPALAAIVEEFGSAALDASGALDRRRMRDRVFADPDARRRLEAILHPRIHDAIVAAVRECKEHYCVLAIPLFAETQRQYAWVDRVIVTDVPRATQVQRLTARPQIDVALAERIIDAQVARDIRLRLADDVIDNAGPIERLETIVSRLHARYQAMAMKRV
jgi:dephospho-CoA kinase